MSPAPKRPPKGTAAKRTYSSPERSQDHSTRERIQEMDLSASPKQLDEALEGYGFFLTDVQLSRLAQYHALLAERSKTQNLTRIVGLQDMILKHYVDCLLVNRFLPELPSPLLDLGTGAGFPGIVLKIMDPEMTVILAESVGKKVAFLREAVELLAMPGLEVVGRSINATFDRRVNGVITRAVEPISATMERCVAWLPRGAALLFMKGPSVDEEKGALGGVGGQFVEEADYAYSLPGGEYSRRLLVYRRR